MVKLTPSQRAWRFTKLCKKLKVMLVNYKKLNKYVHNPKNLLARIIGKDKKTGKPDSPELYAAKVVSVFRHNHVPFRIQIGKFQDASKKMPSMEDIRKMARDEEADCVWIESDGKIYAAYGKNVKTMHKHYPLYSIGELSFGSGHINRLAARFYVNVEETPQVVKGVEPVDAPDIPQEEPIDLRAEPDSEATEAMKGAFHMISPKYFTHRNSTLRKDIVNESFLLLEGVYCDKHNGNLIVVIGKDYDLTECLDTISEGWLSNQYASLKQTVMKFLKKRAAQVAKDGNGIDTDLNKMNTSGDAMKRKKVTDILLDIFTTPKNGKPEFEEGTEELASALIAMVNNSDTVRFVKSGNHMTVKLDDAVMQKFSEMRFKINNLLTNLKDKHTYNVLGKQIKADYEKGTILLRGLVPENPGLAAA